MYFAIHPLPTEDRRFLAHGVLNKINKANKATVGTFFSIRNPQNAMRSFGAYIFTIDWSKSESLKELFLPFKYLGEEKPTGSEKN